MGTNRAFAAPGDKTPPDAYVPLAEKGVASGVATLDADSKIPSAQLPNLSATYAVKPDNGGKPVGKDEIATNVVDYSVVIDGSAPTGSQLTNAISAANILGLPLRLPKGTYVIDQVNIPSGTTIEGSGPGTIIKQSISNKPSMQAIGTDTLLGALTADLVKGAVSISITQSWGLVAGDKIIVSDMHSYAATDASYKSGEMLTVESSSGTSITLRTPVRGSFSKADGAYTVANAARLTKLNTLKNITLRNMAFDGHASAGSLLLCFKNVENLTLEGVSTIGAQSGFCQFDNCYNVDVSSFSLNGLVDNRATGSPGYGFIIKQSCHTVRIHDGISTMSRHAVTTIGGPMGIPRLLRISGIISNDKSSTAVIDTHAAAEGVLISGNVVCGSSIGITVRGRNVTVTGNRVERTLNYGIHVVEEGRSVTILGNTLTECVNYGIRLGAGGSAGTNIEVRDNAITDTKGSGIWADPNQTDLCIVGNLVKRTDGRGIHVDASCTGVHIADNDVIDASLVGTNSGINVTGTHVAGVFDIFGNRVKQSSALMNRAIHTTRTQGRMIGNRAFGTYRSAGTEFNAGAGFTTADNVLYA